MSHYQDQFQKDKEKQAQRSQHLFYSNKAQGLSMVVTMIQQELANTPFDEKKINNMLDQINCLSEKD